MWKKRIVSLLMVVCVLATIAPHGKVSASNLQSEEFGKHQSDFVIGAYSSDVISGGGKCCRTERGLCYINNSGQLLLGDKQLTQGRLSCLNVINDTAYYVKNTSAGTEIIKLSFSDAIERSVASFSGITVKAMYVVNETDFYLLSDSCIFIYHSGNKTLRAVHSGKKYSSFAPTSYGCLYATGELFHYDLYAKEQLIVNDIDSYYIDYELNGGSLVFTKCGSTYQVSLKSAFSGNCAIADFTGYGTVDIQDLLADLSSPDDSTDAPAQGRRSGQPSLAVHRKALSQGVQNIVKRAYQMTDIQWTPQANIAGWNSEMTYYAGTTYTGLPYGQPVYASYVPWSTSLAEFIAYVNNPNSLLYTDRSRYNKEAPYYSIDCSAFVSWAWNLNSRQTTSYIHNSATIVSNTSYADMQVGDCLCLAGSHVVLVTDMTYDEAGIINGVEISESTVNRATHYCCQKTWYGTGYSKSLADLQSKYFDSGYILYRSDTRDNAVYTHSCVVPLESDDCELCGNGQYTQVPIYAKAQVITDTVNLYEQPSILASVSEVAAAGQNYTVITYMATVDEKQWYQTMQGLWIESSKVTLIEYLPSISIIEASFPNGILTSGSPFPIEGQITSHNPLTEIYAAIYSGINTTGIPVQEKRMSLANILSFSIRSSEIDKAMVFNELPNGVYTFVLEITERACCEGGLAAESFIFARSSSFTVGSVSRPIIASGIDVSQHQGIIDWDLASQQIDFVILRCGYGDDLSAQDDIQWDANTEACERLGIPYGAYLYSYATTDVEAESEAQHALRLLNGKCPTMPIYLDLEDSEISSNCTKAEILRHAEIFCECLQAEGYEVGVYANTYWWTNLLTDPAYDSWNRWVAQWSSQINYSNNYTMWQYSDCGSINGISGSIDMNYWYGAPLKASHQHTFTLVETISATCTEAGVYHYCCSSCLEEKTETVAAFGHNYGTWETIVSPTCQIEGVQLSSCSRCSNCLQQMLPQAPHFFENGLCRWCGLRDAQIILGDITGEGDITSADAVLLSRYLTDLAELSDTQCLAADIDGDSDVTSADAVKLTRLLLNIDDQEEKQ